jgi:membrane protease YdiL (CAAX protease family)
MKLLARDAIVVIAAALAGALAVPWRPTVTAAAALLSAGIAVLGLFAWRWSRLRRFVRPPGRGAEPWLAPLAWFGLGLAVGLVLLAFIRLVLEPAVPSIGVRMEAAGHLPVWRRLAIIYVAAVSEEVLFRLLLMSALAGILARLRRHPDRVPTPATVWIANAVAALLFAVVHLPAWGSVTALGPALASTILALNALGGLVLGRVFATRGIGAAMWTHAGADTAIQLIGPLTG